MTEDEYHSDLEIVKKENEPNYISVEIFEEVNRNDSIIKNFRSVINNKNRATSSNLYLMLLNKPFPDFKFQDLNNNWYAKSRFLGKPTVVCFIHPKFQPSRKEIKKLNALNKNNQYHVVAFIVNSEANKSSFNKIEFPILKDTADWSKSNHFHVVPRYMLMNENGVITYFFPEFPDSKTTFRPIREQTKEIFNFLSN
ncbi:TlpA family protein disulfide reductase [Formosa maritima]|nr:redoxin domain-containing protein [Formosa maritima]